MHVKLEDFRSLDRNGGATSAWYLKQRPGINAGDRTCFELVDFTADGISRAIRRTDKNGQQAYAVDLGRERVASGDSVAVAYTYRTIANEQDRLIQLRIDQPSENLTVALDYGDTDIEQVRVIDFIASGRPARVSHTPGSVPGRSINIEFDGWAFAGSGLALVWPAISTRTAGGTFG